MVAPCDELISINAITSEIRFAKKFTWKWNVWIYFICFYAENRCHHVEWMNEEHFDIEINVLANCDKLFIIIIFIIFVKFACCVSVGKISWISQMFMNFHQQNQNDMIKMMKNKIGIFIYVFEF